MVGHCFCVYFSLQSFALRLTFRVLVLTCIVYFRLEKKLVSLAKEKQCEDLQPWVKSICNHLYWVAASTSSNNRELMMEKWLSVANHVQNIHSHDGDLFPHCEHGELEGRERRKKWLKAGIHKHQAK